MDWMKTQDIYDILNFCSRIVPCINNFITDVTDGESYKIENEKPKNFENVKLYASDPWYAPFSSDIGMIQNVKITVPSNDVSGRFFFIIIEQFVKMIFDN